MRLTDAELEKAANVLELEGTLSELFSVKVFRSNLIILATLWSFSSFAFFLIPYYIAEIPSNFYAISVSTATAEIIATLICFWLTNRGGNMRRALALFCLLTAIGTMGVIIFNGFYKGEAGLGECGCYLVLYVGIVTAFDLVYLVVNDLFPTIFLATAYGSCNVAGRFVSIFAPLVAVIPAPVPMLVLLVFSAVCTALPLCLVKVDQKTK